MMDSPYTNEHVVCNGLIRDWVRWQDRRSDAFKTMTAVLEELSPGQREVLRPGPEYVRISLNDVRDIPTLEFSYETVPVTHASIGMRRILALSYLLVWTWEEHCRAATELHEDPASRLVLLFDEIDTHLHPQWQRVLLPSLLEVTRHLQPELEIQIIATTHAPMVLASFEPEYDDQRDALFAFDLEEGEVTLRKMDWRPRGDATGWLTSEVFDLEEARSLPAERAIRKAKEAMRRPGISLDEMRRIHHELHAVLKEFDPFWPRWLATAKAAGVEP